MRSSPYGHPQGFSTTNGVQVTIGRGDTIEVDLYEDANRTLAAGGTTTVDSVVATEGKIVLCPAQSTGTQDGLYYADAVSGATCTMVRVPGFQAGDILNPGTVFRVRSGTVYGGRRLVVQGSAPIVLGTDAFSVELEPDASVLAGVTATTGGNLIGYDDSGNKTTAATDADALDEIYAHLRSASTPCFSTSLNDFREVTSGGDVGNVAAIGGVLASDTTPILRGDAAESLEISWATGNTDIILAQKTLALNFDDTADVTVELWVYSGTTNAATFTVETSWDGGAIVTDTATDATPLATVHRITATIAHADIPAGARNVTIMLTPAAHATDTIQLVGWSMLNAPVLLT